MRRTLHRLAVACLGLALSLAASYAGTARAQGLSVRDYAPAAADTDLGVVRAGAPTGLFHYSLSVQSIYTRDPLVLLDAAGERSHAVIDNQLDLMLGLNLGLWFDTDVAVWLPFTAYQHQRATWNRAGFVAEESTSSGIGDALLQGRMRVMSEAEDGIDLSFAPSVSIPLATRRSYRGLGGVSVTPELLVSRSLGPVLVAVNLGYRVLPDGVFHGVKVVDKLTWRAGLGLSLSALGRADGLRVSLESFGSTSATNPFASGRTSPAEILVGARLRLGALVVGGAAGGGIVHGLGAPVARAVLSLTFAPHAAEDNDADHDGIPDHLDRCIRSAEDLDGFSDTDGCPDPDNDGDGIEDADDRCPNEAEDTDDFEDEDGCPDLDHDDDGVLEDVDQCPNDPEDQDGFQDEDGCPDPDNDEDTIADVRDRCPDDMEDFDEFEDEDGCPEYDNDGDGIVDVDDVCPNEAEVINNVEDEDGCPDEGKQLVTLTHEGIRLDERIHFASESHVIRERSYRLLNQVVALLRNHKTIKRLRIEGHTDATGKAKLNLRLSQRRSRSVRRYLVRRGIAGLRLEALGFGGQKPRAGNADARGRGQNRRVEFIIVEQRSNDPVPNTLRSAQVNEVETPAAGSVKDVGHRGEAATSDPTTEDTDATDQAVDQIGAEPGGGHQASAEAGEARREDRVPSNAENEHEDKNEDDNMNDSLEADSAIPATSADHTPADSVPANDG